MFQCGLVNITLGYYVASGMVAEVDMYSRKWLHTWLNQWSDYRSVLIRKDGHLQMSSYVIRSHKMPSPLTCLIYDKWVRVNVLR